MTGIRRLYHYFWSGQTTCKFKLMSLLEILILLHLASRFPIFIIFFFYVILKLSYNLKYNFTTIYHQSPSTFSQTCKLHLTLPQAPIKIPQNFNKISQLYSHNLSSSSFRCSLFPDNFLSKPYFSILFIIFLENTHHYHFLSNSIYTRINNLDLKPPIFYFNPLRVKNFLFQNHPT